MYTVKTFTSTPVSICQFPPVTQHLFIFIPSSLFMQMYANEIILVFPLGAISKSAHRACLHFSSFLFFFYSCIVFHGWIYQVLFDLSHFQTFGLGFNLFFCYKQYT